MDSKAESQIATEGDPFWSLVGLCPPLTDDQRRQLSPVTLAYVGDAVFELYQRQQVLWPPRKIQDAHQQVVQRVQASAQAALLTALWPHLSATEQQIVAWGRNGCGRGSRHIPIEVYRQASGLETLLGYLSITDRPRLTQILAFSRDWHQSEDKGSPD